MKTISCVLFGLVALLACLGSPAFASDPTCVKNGTRGHDFFAGYRRGGDEMLYFEHPKVSSKLLRVVDHYVNYPNNTRDPRGTITYIEAYDQARDGSGACLYVKSGGINWDHATLRLKSQRGNGIDFVVRIYGYRKY